MSEDILLRESVSQDLAVLFHLSLEFSFLFLADLDLCESCHLSLLLICLVDFISDSIGIEAGDDCIISAELGVEHCRRLFSCESDESDHAVIELVSHLVEHRSAEYSITGIDCSSDERSVASSEEYAERACKETYCHSDKAADGSVIRRMRSCIESVEVEAGAACLFDEGCCAYEICLAFCSLSELRKSLISFALDLEYSYYYILFKIFLFHVLSSFPYMVFIPA